MKIAWSEIRTSDLFVSSSLTTRPPNHVKNCGNLSIYIKKFKNHFSKLKKIKNTF